MHDVFISYSHIDKHVADAICNCLESNGIRCWMAPKDIEPGDVWADSISKAISSSKVFVLVFSDNSNNSNQVSKELSLAVTHRLMLLPFKISNTQPTGQFEYYLSDTHWLDAVNAPLLKSIDKLKEVVQLFLSGKKTSKIVKKPTDLNHILLYAILVAILGFFGLYMTGDLDKFKLHKNNNTELPNDTSDNNNVSNMDDGGNNKSTQFKRDLTLIEIGDFYYSDGSFSKELTDEKQCLGVVYSKEAPYYAKIFSLENYGSGNWTVCEDIIKNGNKNTTGGLKWELPDVKDWEDLFYNLAGERLTEETGKVNKGTYNFDGEKIRKTLPFLNFTANDKFWTQTYMTDGYGEMNGPWTVCFQSNCIYPVSESTPYFRYVSNIE